MAVVIEIQRILKHRLLLLPPLGPHVTHVLRGPVQYGPVSIPQVVDTFDWRGTFFKAIFLSVIGLADHLVTALGLLTFVEFSLEDLWLLHALEVLHGENALRIHSLALTTQGIYLDVLIGYVAIFFIELILLHLLYGVIELFLGFLLRAVFHTAFIMIDTLDIKGLPIEAHGRPDHAMLRLIGRALVLIGVVHVRAIEFVFRVEAKIVFRVAVHVVICVVLESSVSCEVLIKVFVSVGIM